ncbi:MAG: PilT/PilU family type 4a pilus ATPase [Myxococcota bacterium]
MPGLEKFLHYLERGDVSEIVFQSGATAAAKRKGRLQPVTREPLTAQHILKLVHSTPLEGLVPKEDGASAPTAARINGNKYVATVARSGPMLLLRVWLPDGVSEPPNAGTRPVGVPIGGIRPAPANQQVRVAVRSKPPAREPAPASEQAEPRAPVEANPASPATHRPPPVAVKYPDARKVVPRNSYHPPPEASPLADFVPAEVSKQVSSDLESILRDARARSASDVHIVSDEPLRLRCNGYLVPEGPPIPDAKVREMLMPLLDERTEQQFEELGYADFACQLEGAGRLRVNANKQRTGIKGCFRLVMEQPPTLEMLGLPKELRQLLDYHQGLVVVSGPSGAGKTTTLAALVDLFNSERPVHIISVEDPVEILHPIKRAIVSQRQIGAHTKSFQSALKGSLREDPDVIAIGELRDRETVEKALEAAETGHLVFATMSTPSGATTIDRLIDMFPPDDQSQVRATLAGALKFVISQRLVPRQDETGGVAAVELLTGSMPLWSLIRDDKLFQLPSLLQRGRGFGMIRIEDSLNDLLASGTITEKVAKRYADDPRLITGVSTVKSREEAPEKPRRNLFGKKGK